MKQVAVAVAVSFTLGVGVAWARNMITTQAGCNQEFGMRAAKPCVECVKSKGRWVQHAARKGVWQCERR